MPAAAFAVAGLTVGLALALAGCGGSGSEVAVSDPAAASASGTAGATGPADLTVVVRADGKTSTWHLTCSDSGEPGGDHPNGAAACAALAKAGDRALPPVADGMMCTQIYGGDETAKITGTWRGKTVDSRLSRRDGCEISRWEALVGLLPKASGGAMR